MPSRRGQVVYKRNVRRIRTICENAEHFLALFFYLSGGASPSLTGYARILQHALEGMRQRIPFLFFVMVDACWAACVADMTRIRPGVRGTKAALRGRLIAVPTAGTDAAAEIEGPLHPPPAAGARNTLRCPENASG